jgi:hypothetical protein
LVPGHFAVQNAFFTDGAIDFAFEAQFGEMSAKRCIAVLLEAVTSPVLTTGRRPNCRCNRSHPTRKTKVVDERS